jgi:hypothetical protein
MAKVKAHIFLKPGVLDVQGKAVEGALNGLGWTGVDYKAMALTTAALVCVAASNGGTISQDLKTGYLVGATPRLQQIAILVGVVTSAIVIGFVLLLLNESSTTYRAVDFPTYTATKITDQTHAGPDGKDYRVVYLREEVVLTAASEVKAADGTITKTPAVAVARGKYLVDDGGHMMYFVDPGVSGSYPWKLESAKGALPPGYSVNANGDLKLGDKVIGTDEGPELGVDRKHVHQERYD